MSVYVSSRIFGSFSVFSRLTLDLSLQYDTKMTSDYVTYYRDRHPVAAALEIPGVFAVQLAAVAEYMTAEVLELGGNAARDGGNDVISLENLEMAVKGDEELVSSYGERCMNQTKKRLSSRTRVHYHQSTGSLRKAR